MDPLVLRVVSRVAKADRAVEQAALEVYKTLDPGLKHEVDTFLRGVIMGKAPYLEKFVRELYDAYEPVRAMVRKRHGSKVTLYRGEPVDKPALKRKFLSWTPSWKLATHFSGDDHEIIEADVRTSDVIAVLVSPNLRYVEYLVRDRKEYHERQSEEQIPFRGFISHAADGKQLGFPVETELNGHMGYWDFDPGHARREFPKIDRAMKAVGGKLIGKYVNEDDEGAGATVLIPGDVPGIKRGPSGDPEVEIGPYLVTDLRPMAGQSLRMAQRVVARYKSKQRTDKGNTVYLYSERQIANRNKKKAERLQKLNSSIKKLRSKVKSDLGSSDPRVARTALAIGLIDHTYERVGNDESAKEGHFGVTGWTKKHVSQDGGSISYVGKSGVKQKKKVSDAALKNALKRAYGDCDGDCIFSFDGGKVGASDVNSYLTEFDITAKDLRGFHANREMQDRLKAARKGTLPTDKKAREKQLKAEFLKALDETAGAVGHEASTLRSQYLVPGLEETYLKDGKVTGKLGALVYDDGRDAWKDTETGKVGPNAPMEPKNVTEEDLPEGSSLEDLPKLGSGEEGLGDYLQGFFRRHPKLKRYAPRKIREKMSGGAGGHGEARQHGNEIWLFPKFWDLDQETRDFVMAHEIGHYVMSREPSQKFMSEAEAAGVDPWDTPNLPFAQHNMDEAFADSFASYHLAGNELARRYPQWLTLVKAFL